MSSYDMTINWSPYDKMTTVIISPKNKPSISYTTKIPHESYSKYMEFWDVMYESTPWFIDDASSTIKFIDNKHQPIKVVKTVTTKNKFCDEYLSSFICFIINIIPNIKKYIMYISR